MAGRSILIDVHSHIYLPRYASVLRQRTKIPFIRDDRLVILANEPSGGRPVGPQYWSRDEKLAFMDKHGIQISLVSTANPWLDFVSTSEASTLASELNDDLEHYCSTGPRVDGGDSLQRLYGLGLLPIVPDIPISQVLSEIDHIQRLPHIRGIIMGTNGLGNGLDDDDLEPLWKKLSKTSLVTFLHPHYGIDSAPETRSLFGPKSNGHVLPLAIGFPVETAIATTRLILSGVFDRHPDLKLLLAHSGGALPILSSRLASCVAHDPVVAGRLKHDARWYLGKLCYDAVAYGPEELGYVASTIARAGRYVSEDAEGEVKSSVGSSSMMFGTDHPFFPPINGSASKWLSVVENLKAIEDVPGWSEAEKDGVRGYNALRIFGLSEH